MSEAPTWLRRVAEADHDQLDFVRRLASVEGGRASAVLMLFGPGTPQRADSRSGGAHVILTERSHTLRQHPGQVSFPGGRIDPTDDDAVAAALREAEEEVGLLAHGVEVVGQLPRLPLSVTGFSVTPVLGWWREPSPIGVVDRAEVERVMSIAVDDLTDPAHRFMAVHPARRFAAPAFEVGDVYVWGFTAILLAEFLSLAGLAVPWDEKDERPVPERFLR